MTKLNLTELLSIYNIHKYFRIGQDKDAENLPR